MLLDRVSVGVFQDRRVEVFLVPEVIVHGRHVRPRPLANVAHRGRPEPVFGKDFTGRHE